MGSDWSSFGPVTKGPVPGLHSVLPGRFTRKQARKGRGNQVSEFHEEEVRQLSRQRSGPEAEGGSGSQSTPVRAAAASARADSL